MIVLEGITYVRRYMLRIYNTLCDMTGDYRG